MDPEFEKWRKLTDEYAKELSAMQQGDLRARVRVQQLAGEVIRLSSRSSNVMAYPKGQARPSGNGQQLGRR